MALLSDTDRHQAKAIVYRMFEFGGDGRQLGRYLQTQLGAADGGNYAQMREELLDLIREVLNSLYTAPPPTSGR